MLNAGVFFIRVFHDIPVCLIGSYLCRNFFCDDLLDFVLVLPVNVSPEITRPAARYGASPIRILGSVARHTADEKSDIDFLVELAPGRTRFDLGGFAYDLEKLLGKPVDVCTVHILREPVRSRVIAEAISL